MTSRDQSRRTDFVEVMTMSRFPGIAVKTIGAVAAGMLSMGAVSAFAASPDFKGDPVIKISRSLSWS